MTNLLTHIFIKDRDNVTSPRVRRAYGTMVSLVGMIANILLFAAKFTIGMLTGSVSITADAINNLSDAGTQIISFLSFRISAKPADREHPFGHARIEYVASMIVSFFVLLIGVELFKESLIQIFKPKPPEQSWVAVGILIGSIILKAWLGFFNRRIGKRIDSAVMRATAADCFSDVLSTLAVLLSAIMLNLFPSLTLNLDAYVGLIVSVMILVAGVKILIEAKNSILGEAPSDEIVKEITDLVENTPGVLGLHDLTVHNYGPGHIIAALHVEVDGKKDIFHTHDLIDNVERRLRQECGIEATIHMDPIVTDDARVTALRARVEESVREIDGSFRIHDFRFVEGNTHTNLIFDVVVPFECQQSDDALRRAVSERIHQIDPTYFSVITVDRG